MRKQELQAGIIPGVLWLFWIIITLNPQMLHFVANNMDNLLTPAWLKTFGTQAAIVVLILGLLMNQRAIVGLSCLMMIGLDGWELLRMKNVLTMFLRGGRSLYPVLFLAEALSFLLLFLIAARGKSGGWILSVSVFALISQISKAMMPGSFRMPGNPELLVPGIIMYVLAMAATGMYCAGIKPEMLNELFRKSRNTGSPGKEYRSLTTSLSRGSSGEDIRKDRATESAEKKERIKNLKALLDNGLMSKEEYNEMVEKIRRS